VSWLFFQLCRRPSAVLSHKYDDLLYSTVKVAISIDEHFLQELDRLVRSHVYPNRSKAIQDAVADKLARLKKTRLLRESRKLDPNEEHAVAEEWLSGEEKWPEF
jgi:Arc/MetJ-type ribon-helix-helix transcriptional regulator